jgi:hypothetical protein
MATNTKVQFWLHRQSAGEFGGSRRDLAITENGIVRHVFTLGVEKGGTVGSGCTPFTRGESIESAHEFVARYNHTDGACACGAKELHHVYSAGCDDHSSIEEISTQLAFELIYTAKRPEVRSGLIRAINNYRQAGLIRVIVPI